MKKIRRTRITVRQRETVIVKNNEGKSHFEETEQHFCPLCKTLLHSKSQTLAACDRKLLTGSEILLTEEN